MSIIRCLLPKLESARPRSQTQEVVLCYYGEFGINPRIALSDTCEPKRDQQGSCYTNMVTECLFSQIILDESPYPLKVL